LHDVFYQQTYDRFIHKTTATCWVCPSNCGYGYGDGVLQPSETPCFPHVECPGCHDRFCANYKALWHDGQTCQQYRAQHPELHDKDEVARLHDMARLGARRCPRCQLIIIKQGGPGDDEGNQQAGANEQPIQHPLLDMIGPPSNATGALIDRMLMTAIQPGERQVVFGFGLGILPMQVFERDEEDEGQPCTHCEGTIVSKQISTGPRSNTTSLLADSN
jgi:hypothetical protein